MRSKRYITKPGQWYKEGTEAKLLSHINQEIGLFEGVRIDYYGKEVIDEEVCRYDEFDVIEE